MVNRQKLVRWRTSTTGIGDYVEPEERKLWRKYHSKWTKFKGVYFFVNWVPLYRPINIEEPYLKVKLGHIYAWNKNDIDADKYREIVKEFCKIYHISPRIVERNDDPGGW
jgi:hypothetical protein